MPTKEDNVVFDQQNSYCTNGAQLLWDYETWSPIILNMTEYKMRCSFSFRDYYRVEVLDRGESNIYNVSLSNPNLIFPANLDHVLLNCNQGVQILYENQNINMKNIHSDVLCTYSDSTIDAINNLDDSKNYFLYLLDENINNELTILSQKDVTMDLNGHQLVMTHSVYNYGKLMLVSSNSNFGSLEFQNNDARFLFSSYDSSILHFNHINLTTFGNVIDIYDYSSLIIENSKLLSTTSENYSAVWLHGGNTNAEFYNASIEGSFGIGGEGGKILIDSSEIKGNKQTGLQINAGFSGNVFVQNSSTIYGYINGISMDSGVLTFYAGDEGFPVIHGQNDSGILMGYSNTNSIFNYNAGEIYGKRDVNINGTINVVAGKKMTSVIEEGIVHTYLE